LVVQGLPETLLTSECGHILLNSAIGSRVDLVGILKSGNEKVFQTAAPLLRDSSNPAIVVQMLIMQYSSRRKQSFNNRVTTAEEFGCRVKAYVKDIKAIVIQFLRLIWDTDLQTCAMLRTLTRGARANLIGQANSIYLSLSINNQPSHTTPSPTWLKPVLLQVEYGLHL